MVHMPGMVLRVGTIPEERTIQSNKVIKVPCKKDNNRVAPIPRVILPLLFHSNSFTLPIHLPSLLPPLHARELETLHKRILKPVYRLSIVRKLTFKSTFLFICLMKRLDIRFRLHNEWYISEIMTRKYRALFLENVPNCPFFLWIWIHMDDCVIV